QAGDGPVAHERVEDELLLEPPYVVGLAPVHEEEPGAGPEHAGDPLDGAALVGEVAGRIEAYGAVEGRPKGVHLHDVVLSEAEVGAFVPACVGELGRGEVDGEHLAR